MKRINIKAFCTKQNLINALFVIVGSIILAFGTAIFLIESDIVAGGLSGIGIIVYNFTGFDVSLFVLILSWILFFIGLFVLGIKFAINTLISTIVYPLALMLFTRVPLFLDLAALVDPMVNGVRDNALLLINGIFGGAFVGVGCALTFVGKGSTGGVDIIYFILYKYFKVKESISSIAIDAAIILSAMIALPNDQFISCLIGILSALTTALMIQIIYINNRKSILIEVISSDYLKIDALLAKVSDKKPSIVTLENDDDSRKMVRVIIENKDYHTIKNQILATDSKASIVISDVKKTHGLEGTKKK
ncbi:MAG: YitT family protein [Erysipelotrichaceae bacterium]|jgi:uncharacterized membrane-anchored protein YitT (DUF2179 family)|nr:YitT family protein [Erysipelotrichaceae bacterium]